MRKLLLEITEKLHIQPSGLLWWFSNNTLFLGGIFLILAGYKSK